ncbi:protein kinase family protein [Blastococcus saxobsidens]|nr:protein kinase family protein [Blastococcus saxobsidens]
MASTTTGLPDRYRPLDQIGPDEITPTGVIQCWRAKDRVLNRDVAIRVHTPAGPAAHAWITRALTAGGLATPALAMVYDASEGSGDPQAPGGAAYVVNEWIDGETLADRLRSGPMPEREVRLTVRRLAEGVAEAHRVGLAVGGLTLDNVVLRPNGLVGLRAVPAAAGTVDGDIQALGELLEACLTGVGPGARGISGPSDLIALARRARSTEPGQRLSSVAAMASLLAERPRTGPTPTAGRGREADDDGGRRRWSRDRRPEAVAPVRLEPGTLPPVPPVRPVTQGPPLSGAALGADTVDAGSIGRSGLTPPPPAGRHPLDEGEESFGVLPDGGTGYDDRSDVDFDDDRDDEDGARRHKLVVVGLPLLALAVVIALAWWFGSSVLSVAGSVDDQGSTPSVSAPADGSTGGSEEPAAEPGSVAAITAADVFDPFGDGEPENTGQIPASYDGDPASTWSTLTYRGSPAFGNLKPGVGVLYDLGEAQQVSGVTLTSPSDGATVEIRTGEAAGQALEDFTPAADGTLGGSTDLEFGEPVTARYVLVWVTGLVNAGDGFAAELGEVEIRTAG